VATTLDALNALASGFSIADVTPSPGTPLQFVVHLVPPGGRSEGPLTVDVTETVSQLTDATVDIGFLTKNVRFKDFPVTGDPSTLVGGDVIGGSPIADPEVLAGTFSALIDPFTEGDATKPGVPGILGRLKGTYQLPMDVTQTTTLAVQVEVQWHIRDENGNPIADVAWSDGTQNGTGQPPALTANEALADLTLTFSAVFVELTSAPTPVAQRSISASIRLSAGQVSTGFVDLPPVTVPVPAIPVPTALLLFQDSSFKNNKLVVVPASSPIVDPAKDALKTALDTLNTALGDLGGAVGLASFFVSNLQTVKDAIDAGGNFVFRKTDSISNLNDIDLEGGFFNDTEAEDELSSLIFVGPPRRKVQAFNARSFSDSEGEMDVTVGPELLVLAQSLHSNSPASDPAGRISVPKAPTGSRDLGFHDITSFGDELSSLRFGFE
jgi:hypothetical protein